MARPSLEVAPVMNTSDVPLGISFRITAAVSVLPWTTRTRRSGCFFTNSVPPPLSASFCAVRVHTAGHISLLLACMTCVVLTI